MKRNYNCNRYVKSSFWHGNKSPCLPCLPHTRKLSIYLPHVCYYLFSSFVKISNQFIKTLHLSKYWYHICKFTSWLSNSSILKYWSGFLFLTAINELPCTKYKKVYSSFIFEMSYITRWLFQQCLFNAS